MLSVCSHAGIWCVIKAEYPSVIALQKRGIGVFEVRSLSGNAIVSLAVILWE